MAFDKRSFSWSLSKSNILKECKKKYFFIYFTFFLKQINKEIWLETLLIKNLKSLDMRKWELLHKIIWDYLRLVYNSQDSESNIGKIKADMEKEIDEYYLLSKKKDYKKYDKYNKFWLSEHFYWMNVDRKFFYLKEEIFESFEIFCESELLKYIKEQIEKEYKIYIEPREAVFEKMKTKMRDEETLKDVDLFAQPDFGIIKENKEYFIYDWKSWKEYNKSEETSDQLKAYAYKLLLNLAWNFSWNDINIFCKEVYLPSLNFYGGKITPKDISFIKEKIKKDVEFEKEKLNIGYDYFMDNFPRTENVKKCENCRFRKVCFELKKLENVQTLFS